MSRRRSRRSIALSSGTSAGPRALRGVPGCGSAGDPWAGGGIARLLGREQRAREQSAATRLPIGTWRPCHCEMRTTGSGELRRVMAQRQGESPAMGDAIVIAAQPASINLRLAHSRRQRAPCRRCRRRAGSSPRDLCLTHRSRPLAGGKFGPPCSVAAGLRSCRFAARELSPSIPSSLLPVPATA
jgi:hypothetical protein